jgi:hypothetical protein
MFQRIARASAGPNSDMRCVMASLFSSEPSMHLQLLAVDKSMEQRTQFKLLRYGRDEETRWQLSRCLVRFQNCLKTTGNDVDHPSRRFGYHLVCKCDVPDLIRLSSYIAFALFSFRSM